MPYNEKMRVIANIFWFLLGGLPLGLAYIGQGLLSMITIIGIPFGIQFFKIVPLAFAPFGKGIRYPKVTGFKVLGNILWAIIFGWWNAFLCFLTGLLLHITIIGIPLGKQYWKFARLLFLPFGAEVYNAAAEKKEEKRAQKREERLVREAATAAAAAAVAATAAAQNSSRQTLPNTIGASQQFSTSGNLPAAAVVQTDDTEWVCPGCGKSNDAEYRFCDVCGTPKPVSQQVNVQQATYGQQVYPQQDYQQQAAVQKNDSILNKDMAETAKKYGAEAAEAAKKYGAKASEAMTTTVIPAAKKAGVSMKNGFFSFCAFAKKQCLSFVDFLKSHKEQIKKVLPYVLAAVAGIIAIILIISFIGSVSSKAAVISAYSAEQRQHDEAVAEAEETIRDYEERTNKLKQLSDDLNADIAEKQSEENGYIEKINQLENEASSLENEKNALSELEEKFGNIGAGYNSTEYAEQQLTDIINSQQNSIYELKEEINTNISMIYSDWNIGNGYSYQVSKPADIGGELAKEIIGSVAGEYDSEIAGVLSGAASNVVDGEDIVSALSSQIQETVQTKIADAVTGGLYSTFNDIADTANAFQSAYDTLSDTTPDYVLRHLYAEIQVCVEELGGFLDDGCVTAEDLSLVIASVKKLAMLVESTEDIKNTIGLTVPMQSLVQTAEEAYGMMIADNERMLHYFALMEE